MKIQFNFKLFFFLTIGFILFTAIGTVSHEFGHKLAGMCVGIQSEISYDSTQITYINPANADFDHFIFSLGGPLQTILTGIIGLAFIYTQRRKINQSENPSALHWFFILTSLFWLRQIFNFLHEIYRYLALGNVKSNNDEVKIARYLDLPLLSVSLLTGIVAALVLAYVFYKIIPKQLRITFIASGLVGGIAGIYLWMDVLGPILMP